MTDYIILRSFFFLKNLERHWRFINCEVQRLSSKNVIASSGREFQSGGTLGLECDQKNLFGLLNVSVGSEDGKEALKLEKNLKYD